MENLKFSEKKSYYLVSYEFNVKKEMKELKDILSKNTIYKWMEREKEDFGLYLSTISPIGIIRIINLNNKYIVDVLLNDPTISEKKWLEEINNLLLVLKKIGLENFKKTDGLY